MKTICKIEYTGLIPSVNQSYGISRNGRIYLKRPVKDFKRALGYLCLSQKPKMSSKRIRINIEVSFMVKLRDIDNVIKASIDGLKGIVFVDDSQVDYISVKRLPDKENYLMITVKEV